ncbi:MAG: hypothetical protein ACRDSZ_16285 [Pseudonocardiaceae bacterium]
MDQGEGCCGAASEGEEPSSVVPGLYPRWYYAGLRFRGSSDCHGLPDSQHGLPDKLVDFRTAQRRVMVDEQPTGDRVSAYLADAWRSSKCDLQELGDTRPTQHHRNVPTLAPWDDGPRSFREFLPSAPHYGTHY